MSEKRSPSTVGDEPTHLVYDLFRQFRRILLDCEQFDSPREMARSVLRTLLAEAEQPSLVRGGRLYVVGDEGLTLIEHYGDAGDLPLGSVVPLDHPAVQLLQKHGYFALDQLRPERIGDTLIGAPPFAAIAIGPNKDVVIGLALPSSMHASQVESAVATLYSIQLSCWQRHSLSAELAQAAEVQRSLLAGAVTEIPGYELAHRMRSAEIVGGDFYDVSELAGGTYAIAIGDATGHGLSAALQARDAVTGLRMGLEIQFKVSMTFQRLDRVLSRSSAQSRFVSLAYLELDRRGNLISVNAGHPAPLILDPRTRTVRELPATGTLLGLRLPEVPIHQREFDRLAPGEILVACTDGILEATDPSDREYGTARLREVCFRFADRPLPELLDQIFLSVEDHGQSDYIADDQTVVLLRKD